MVEYLVKGITGLFVLGFVSFAALFALMIATVAGIFTVGIKN